MTSRLDRLFILLESGSSAITRKAAAKQIGEVQKLHPHELHNLLNRLMVYLHSNNWDTRIAASQAVQAILDNVPQWNPNCVLVTKEESSKEIGAQVRLNFNGFNLDKVLEKGAELMGSEGNEFDVHDDGDMDDQELMIKQKALLNEKLGLSAASNLGIGIDDLVTVEDMRNHRKEPSNSNKKQVIRIPVQEILEQQPTITILSGMSCREKNRAKRKARQNQSTAISSSSPSPNGSRSNSMSSFHCEEPERKKIKSEDFVDSTPNVPDITGSWNDAQYWPLEAFCSKLYLNLFSPRWESRHGSATALRELLKSHIAGAGKSIYMTRDEMIKSHEQWLEDAALRLLCVLALDRFGDFIADQVTAPVRETCAQVLGTVLQQMPIERVHETVEILLKFIKQKNWEVRHAGLLGIKYMLVVREDLIQKFLPVIFNDVLTGLFDSVDDVGAVAASALIPIASYLPKLLNPKQVSYIVKMLWDLLMDQDELSSTCCQFMGLLAAILSLPHASQWIEMEPMTTLIPRLWPFLSHPSGAVRRSTLQTLKKLTDDTDTVKLIKLEPTEHKENGFSQPTTSNNLTESEEKETITLNMNGTNSKDLVLNFGVREWPHQLLQDALRHIFQRVLVEHVEDIQGLVEGVWSNLIKNADLSALLHAACPFVTSFLCMAMQPPLLAFDQSLIIEAKPITVGRKIRPFDTLNNLNELEPLPQLKFFLGGSESVPQDVRRKNLVRARYKACKMIGLLSKYLVLPAPGVVYTDSVETPVDCYAKVLLGYLQSRSALQRLISSMVITFWAENDPSAVPGPLLLQDKLRSNLMEQLYYDEVAVLFTRLLYESRDFLSNLKQNKILLPEYDNLKVLTLDQIHTLCTKATENIKEKFLLKAKVAETLEGKKRSLLTSYNVTSTEQSSLNISTQSALASAVIRLQCLPEKLNPVVKPLMESIKKEECEIFQKFAADNLTHLLGQIITREPCPNSKIISNLCILLKGDADFTPKIEFPQKELSHFKPNNDPKNPYYGIVTLANQQKAKDGIVQNVARGPGRPSAAEAAALEEGSEVDDPNRKLNQIQRIGATHAISSICSYFAESLPEKMPIMYEIMYSHLQKVDEDWIVEISKKLLNQDETNDILTSLQLIEVAAPSLSPKLHKTLFQLLPKLCILLKHPLKAIRSLAARCMSTLALLDSTEVLTLVMDRVIPLLATIENAIIREGSAEAIACIVNKLQFQIVPYVVLLIVPLLGRMSDPDQSVRLLSTNCFATLIQLMPLDGISPDTKELSPHLKLRKLKDKEFLEYLFAPKTIPDFKIPIPINAELRSYQQAGVNWLWFLNKYKLHGILCDEMGLGKTLQTVIILAADHFQRKTDKLANLPSLVICPPTLTGHWVFEINKFLHESHLKPLHYYGLPIFRENLRTKLSNHNLVVASYDIVRKDIEWFKSVNWNYCVLDEGHIIKNGKTKVSKAIKQLIANNRLILSGTPIQNNVLELWSLFDFLMPGFLGTEKQFAVKFSRPILNSRESKSSLKDQEAGVLAMESLHRQVLPFLLRRNKQDVLTDLPPKITQDLLCELSPLQERLYEDFSKSHSDVKDCLDNIDSDGVQKKTHVFQALRYLQNVCNHPKLVLKPNHPEYKSITADLMKKNTPLDDIEHSAKLPALKQLLIDCGIGINEDTVNQHRALIFCQLKSMLDIVENDLLKKHLRGVSYLRLDGTIPTCNRYSIVTKFNNDPSIDVLLLTTQVGGLGLNLTGADTVIFVEHDWNPMKDLQAMDRAHRIGQRKVVNVYRLITRKSLEEKIMGLQKFKILTANTVVSNENSSMETMGTDQLLDLFSLSDDQKHKATKSASNDGIKNVLENLPDLWDNRQYEEEYDMTSFIQSLKK